ncbi:MAG: hypothetical protein RMN25_08830, partial [Anaerolineae bacterium]|nr:hypothetical protein [Thermoflexales bacterium]MDW8407878.1 hypothetical protein [Anaerolineae bacterium]
TLALFGVLGIGGAALLAARGNVIARAGIGAGILIAVTAVTALSILRVEPFRMTNPGLLGGSPLAVLAVLPAGIVTVKTPSLRFLRPAIAVILVGFVVGAFLMPRLASRAGGVMVQIGSTWGSRYFLMLYPLLALVALTHVTAWLRAVQHGDASSVQRRWRTAGAVALGAGISVSLIGSFLVNGVGLARMITDKSIVWAGCQAVWRTEAPVLVTDDWWLAPECAARPTLAYLLVENPDMLPILTSNLYAAGTTQLAYASQTGRLSLNALIASLERCFLVQTVQGQPAGQQGGPVVLNLTPRSPTCPDTSHTFEYQVDQS